MYKLERKERVRLTSKEVLTPSDFDDIAKELGVAPLLAQKVGFVVARRAEQIEQIDTYSKGYETKNTAQIGDWIVTSMSPEREALRDAADQLDTYVISAGTFERLYQAMNISTELGELFSAKGVVSAISLSGGFDILAPWKERQRGKSGYLVRNDQEVYGIEASAFHATYDQLGPAAHRLLRPGRKRILSLDGGGVRGMLTLAILERLEEVLRRQHGNSEFVLADYFDMIGGTSVGAILATQLALGDEVAKVKALFAEWCPGIFKRPAFWREPRRWIPFIGHLLVPQFDARHLERRLQERLGDMRLGAAELKTGLCVVTKRVDTGSPWVLTNNPRSKFWYGNKDRVVANKEYRLADVVRASAAAPHFFKPHEIQVAADTKEKSGLFVDGAVSPYNNPALQMLMLAGIRGYGLDWALGEDNLLIVSVGTGSYRQRSSRTGISAKQAVEALAGVIGDSETLTLTLLQWMGASKNYWKINSEIGDLSDDFLGSEQGQVKPLLRFQRYDARLEDEWLKEQLNLSLPEEELTALRDFSDPRNLSALYEIGRAAAVRQIQLDHFPDAFKVDATPG